MITNILAILGLILLITIVIVYPIYLYFEEEITQTIKRGFSYISKLLCKDEKTSLYKDFFGKKDEVEKSIAEVGIKGYTGEGLSAGATIYFDPQIIDQLNSMQKQINALSADLYRLEEADYEYRLDFWDKLISLSDAIHSKKKPSKKKVVKKKYDDHKVHTKAYKNATKAKK